MTKRVTRPAVLATVLATCLSGTIVGSPAATGTTAPAQPAAHGKGVQEIRSVYTSEVGVRRPLALRWSSTRDALVVTGTGRHGRLRAVAMATDGSRIGRAPVRSVGHHQPNATDPGTRIRYVADADGRGLAARTADGRLVRKVDISRLGIKHLNAMTFAPSSDTTDPAGELSLYLADGGNAATLGRVVELDLTPMAAVAPNAASTLAATRDTSVWNPPSPDPSGVVYNPSTDRLVVSDGEVDEMPIYAGANLYTATRQGGLTSTATTLPWSNEPTGIAYNATNAHFFTTDDDKKTVFEYVTPSGGPVIANGFKTSTFGDTDAEDLAYDGGHNQLLLVSGVDREVFLLKPGPNGTFNGVPPSGDDIVTQFDIEKFGALDPEGIAYDAVRDTIVVVDQTSKAIYELDFNGSLLNVIDISAANTQKAAGITIAPASNGSGARNYYIVDRGLDNNSHPTENDGKFVEVNAPLAPITNRPPAANAGPDQMVDLPQTANLTGTAVDDGLPNGALGYAWSMVSGPGTVAFGSPAAASTTASFGTVGTYVLRFTVDDSQLNGFDDVIVTVYASGAPRTVTLPITSGSDDAQEGGGSSGKFVDVASADVELGNNGAATPAQMLDGLRFTGVPVPPGGTILSAKIQFKVDETGSQAAAYSIRGEAADNPTTYLSVGGNISARPSTAATASWSPPPWTLIGEAGPNQATPELSAIVQELVNRPGWAEGNAVAFMIDGTGRRTAEAKDGLSPPVLVLTFRLPGPPQVNGAPVVSAGPDRTVVMPALATLDGTVTDDGLVQLTPTTAWSKVSGPGNVSFRDAGLVDTTAAFSSPGTYTLRLTADDGALTASDEVVVEVRQAPQVSAGPDRSIKLGQSAFLDGTLISAGYPGPATVQWTRVSGPGAVSFSAATSVDTNATFSKNGSYVLRLTATNSAVSGFDDVVVKVAKK